MDRLAYLTAMALLGIGLTVGQNTRPSSDQSNSSNGSAQTQSGTMGGDQNSPEQNGSKLPARRGDKKGAPSQSSVPDPTIQDQQSSTTSTTGAAGQENTPPSKSTMGTTGSTEAPDETQQGNLGATKPQTGTPDQQPNPSANPSTPPPHAELLQTPAARAVATHTPDPGTCMNPAALQTGQNGQPISPNCE